MSFSICFVYFITFIYIYIYYTDIYFSPFKFLESKTVFKAVLRLELEDYNIRKDDNSEKICQSAQFKLKDDKSLIYGFMKIKKFFGSVPSVNYDESEGTKEHTICDLNFEKSLNNYKLKFLFFKN